MNRHTFLNIRFSWKSNYCYIFGQSVQKAQFFWCKAFFQSNHLKANSPSISEHPYFCSIFSQFKDCYSCECSPLELTASKKKQFFLLFQDKQHIYLVNQKIRTTKTTLLDSWVRGIHFEPKGGGQTLQKVVQWIFQRGGSRMYTEKVMALSLVGRQSQARQLSESL